LTLKKRKKERRTNFLVVKWIIFCSYRRDSNNLSRKTVRTGFAVSRSQKPENIHRKSYQLKGFLINAQYCRKSKSFHEFLVFTVRGEIKHRTINRKHAPRRIPKVKLKLALLDELAKQPETKSEMSAKNKRNILVRLLC